MAQSKAQRQREKSLRVEIVAGGKPALYATSDRGSICLIQENNLQPAIEFNAMRQMRRVIQQSHPLALAQISMPEVADSGNFGLCWIKGWPMRIYGCKKKEYIILATTCELSLLNSHELLTLFEKHPVRFLAVSGLAFLCGRTTDTHPYIMQRISVMYNRTLIHIPMH